MKAEEEKSVEVPSPEEEVIPKEPSRLTLLMIKVLRWAAGIALIFALGVVLTLLVRVLPMARDLRSLRDDLATANAQIADLEDAVSELEDLEQDYAAMKAGMDSFEQHINLLKILSDVGSARLALANDNPSAARASLGDTDERMAALQAFLEGEEANIVVGLRVRLQQAISEIDSNAFAADGDLLILDNGLRNLESQVFNE